MSSAKFMSVPTAQQICSRLDCSHEHNHTLQNFAPKHFCKIMWFTYSSIQWRQKF